MAPRRAGARPKTWRRRIFSSVTPAVLGMAAGYSYAFYTLDEKLLTGSRVPAMYACMGAVVGVLTLRLGTLFWIIIKDFSGR